MNIGIDIGGSHIGFGLVDDDGKIKEKMEKKISYIEKADIEKFIENTIICYVKDIIYNKNIKIQKIGIGVPGVILDNYIKYSVNLNVNEYNLVAKLRNEFKNIKINIKNDAKCAALAEKNIGALKQYSDCVFICIGTGIGGAYFYNNELVIPERSSGFEFGHMIIEKNGDLCRCGSNGCFETYASMRKLKNDIKFALNLSDEIEGELLLKIIKENLYKEKVQDIINEYIKNLTIGISNIINMLEPQAICIGGGFAYYKGILFEKLKKELISCDYIFYKNEIPQIVIAELGNNAGIIGSALYA